MALPRDRGEPIDAAEVASAVVSAAAAEGEDSAAARLRDRIAEGAAFPAGSEVRREVRAEISGRKVQEYRRVAFRVPSGEDTIVVASGWELGPIREATAREIAAAARDAAADGDAADEQENAPPVVELDVAEPKLSPALRARVRETLTAAAEDETLPLPLRTRLIEARFADRPAPPELIAELWERLNRLAAEAPRADEDRDRTKRAEWEATLDLLDALRATAPDADAAALLARFRRVRGALRRERRIRGAGPFDPVRDGGLRGRAPPDSGGAGANRGGRGGGGSGGGGGTGRHREPFDPGHGREGDGAAGSRAVRGSRGPHRRDAGAGERRGGAMNGRCEIRSSAFVVRNEVSPCGPAAARRGETAFRTTNRNTGGAGAIA